MTDRHGDCPERAVGIVELWDHIGSVVGIAAVMS